MASSSLASAASASNRREPLEPMILDKPAVGSRMDTMSERRSWMKAPLKGGGVEDQTSSTRA